MKALDRVLKRMGLTRGPAKASRMGGGRIPRMMRIPALNDFVARTFDAADVSRLTASWSGNYLTGDGEMMNVLARIRARARDLENNNDYGKRYLDLCVNNVVGPQGVIMQSKVLKDNQPELDTAANAQIEDAWARWCRRGVCDVTGMYSWPEFQRMVIRSTARDGEGIVIKVASDNPFGFALQFLEADHLNEKHNADLDNGNRIVMGVELNPVGRPVAYHVIDSQPDYLLGPHPQSSRRIPAELVIHQYLPRRSTGHRGLPWMTTVMGSLQNLGKYREAELVASRVAAAKMGFYSTPAGEFAADSTDEQGNFIQDSEPGTFEVLPAGYELKSWDPQHPAGNYGTFTKDTLKGIAAGLGVSYTSLANDLEAVNYSSIRTGMLTERDTWRTIQNWFIESLCRPIYEEWLMRALLTKQVKLPASKFEKFNRPRFVPRGWDWVDPLKDIQAAKEAMAVGLASHTEVLAEKGKDFEDVARECAQDRKMLADLGVAIQLTPTPPPAAPPAPLDVDGKE